MAGRKQSAVLDLAIGVTIVAAVIIVVAMILAWGNQSSFLSKSYKLIVEMDNVGGLREGAPVKVGGFQIGKVDRIQLRSGRTATLEVVLNIDESRLLPKGSTAKISTAGLVGDAFMEIIPSQSGETIARAETVADAERIASSPIPDYSMVLSQVNQLGGQLTELVGYINEIMGDGDFRKSLKSAMANLDAASYEANLILQRAQTVVDGAEKAAQNVSALSETLKTGVERATGTIVRIADSAEKTMANLDGGIADARAAVNNSLGDARFVQSLRAAVENAEKISASVAGRRKDLEEIIANLKDVSDSARSVAGDIGRITGKVEPERIASALNSLSAGIEAAVGLVDRIKEDPVLALSVNKAADRIVKIKFDEMAKQPQFRTSDAILGEITRWTREALDRGYYEDPAYPRDRRPYAIP